MNDLSKLPSLQLLFPLREEARNLLRAKCLFEEMDHFRRQSTHPLNQKAALKALASLIELLKTTSLLSYLASLLTSTPLDIQILKNIDPSTFLTKIARRLPLLAGLEVFDIPLLSCLEINPGLIIQQFSIWDRHLTPFKEVFTQALNHLRKNASTIEALAVAGYYQQHLDPREHAWFVSLDCPHPYYAEITANQQRLHLRFFELGANLGSSLAQDDIHFNIQVCGAY